MRPECGCDTRLCNAQEKRSALDELERQADLIEEELAERERKLQARHAVAGVWLETQTRECKP